VSYVSLFLNLTGSVYKVERGIQDEESPAPIAESSFCLLLNFVRR